MTLQQLKYALEIARTGSMNEAAKRLYVSQPALSSAIKELEEELGVELFERSNRGISLSKEGSEFLAHAAVIIDQAEFIERKYIDKAVDRSRFALSTQHYAFVVEACIDVMEQMASKNYDITIKETTTKKVIEDVWQGKSELGIIFISEFNQRILKSRMREYQLLFNPAAEVKPCAVVSKNHPIAKKKSIELQEILEYPFAGFGQEDESSLFFIEELIPIAKQKSKQLITISDRGTLTTILSKTNAYTIGTGILVKDSEESALRAIPIEDAKNVTLGWVVPQNRKLSEIAELFLKKAKRAVDSRK